jgi:hypothetical protein
MREYLNRLFCNCYPSRTDATSHDDNNIISCELDSPKKSPILPEIDISFDLDDEFIFVI